MDTETLHKQLCARTGMTAALPLRPFTVSGPDAQDFLQGQLTLDLAQLLENEHRMTAWCNAKGRVWCLLRVWRTADGFGLLVPDNQADSFIKRLRMFVLRAKVSIGPSDHQVFAQFEAQDSAKPGQAESRGSVCYLHHGPEYRLLIRPAEPVPSADARALDAEQYVALRILAGEAQLDAAHQEKYLPQSIGLSQLGGLHFNKGCYVGQEIVARVHYRGKAPQQLRHAIGSAAEPLDAQHLLCSLTIEGTVLNQWVENIKA